jgi:hypothetical protein
MTGFFVAVEPEKHGWHHIYRRFSFFVNLQAQEQMVGNAWPGGNFRRNSSPP